MKPSNLQIFLILFGILFSTRSMATGQYGDKLIIGNDTFWIHSNPLEEYFDNKKSRTIGTTNFEGFHCTALWRGYVATWKIQNDSLFLVRLQSDYCSQNPTEIGLVEEFGTDQVFSNWVNSTIVKPEGNLMNYVHMGYLSIYEGESFYSFNNGILTLTKRKDYLVKDVNKTYPGPSYLQDTIRKMILKAIPLANRQEFDEDKSCTINIRFNKDGEIENISLGYSLNSSIVMDTTILNTTKELLANFPPLMKVNHERYHVPDISIWFSGHCLKFPYDRKYGCHYE